MNCPGVAGVVLAGGRSRRMGGNDKSRLLLGGRPMLAWVIDRMRPQVGAMAVSSNDEATPIHYPNLPVLDDGEFRLEGPLAGILAGMRWASRSGPCDWIATAATDAPFIPPDFVRRLVGATDQPMALRLAASEGRVHPVFGLWPVALAPALDTWLAAGGSRKVHDWVRQVPHAVVEFESADGVDPFFNVNTPADAEVARAHLVGLQGLSPARSGQADRNGAAGIFDHATFAHPHGGDARPDLVDDEPLDARHFLERPAALAEL